MKPDPALGFDVDFDNDGFRSAIKFAMQMGTVSDPDDESSPDPDKAPRFIKRGTGPTTYWDANGDQILTPVRTGRKGEPLDPSIEVRKPADQTLNVDCVVELERVNADETGVGKFMQTRVVVTLLDVDYDKLEGVKELIYNGDRYFYDYEPDVNALFAVGVHTLIFKAKDES